MFLQENIKYTLNILDKSSLAEYANNLAISGLIAPTESKGVP